MLSHHNAHHGGMFKFGRTKGAGLALDTKRAVIFENLFKKLAILNASYMIVTLISGVDSRWRNFPTIKKTMVVHHVSNHTGQTCPKRNDRESLDYILWKTSFSKGLGK